MNGRIERIDARLELNSEHNYSAVDFFFAENQRRKKIRRRIEGWVALACFFGWLWFVIWGAAGNIR
jgi:hypothetical protein